MAEEYLRIGIAGFGFVGQAVYNSLIDKDVFIYDKYMEDYNEIELIKYTNILFCALPSVNVKGKQDFSPYIDLFEYLIDIKYSGIVVIKSTVLFENIKQYFSELNIVISPEFLNQNTSFEDFKVQDYIVLGGRVDMCISVESIYRDCFNIKIGKVEYVTQEQAIDFKYLRNIKGAYEVLFWNFVNENFNTDVRKLSDMLSNLSQGLLSNVAADGKFGFGGACFIKDLAAKNSMTNDMLTNFMIDYNKYLRK